jgi:hypothetical protein
LTCLFNTPSDAADTCPVASFGALTVSNVRAIGSTVTADFNSDGRVDVATAATSGDTISVALGGGDGTFALASVALTGSRPLSIGAGDFNGDAKTDLVTAHSSNTESKLTLLLGDGAGGFLASSDISIMQASTDTFIFMVVADFNADGKADVAAELDRFHTVAVLLGDGAGNFTNKKLSDSGLSPAGFLGIDTIAAADFNRDGKLDLVVGNASGVSALLGDGAGGFAAPVAIRTDIRVLSVAVGDFNRDGKPDLAAAGFNITAAVSVLLGDGDGGFGPPTIYSSEASWAVPIKSADFNGDGHADLAVNDTSGLMLILQGDGAGGFRGAAAYAEGNRVLSAGDLDGDGRTDLIVTSEPEDFVTTLLNTCGTAEVKSALQFNQPLYSAPFEEPNGSVTVTVVRTGSLEGAATVDYASSDGTADASDYVPLSGTAHFAAGVASKNILINIKDDQISEGEENFNLTLSNPTGATLGGQSRAVFLIGPSDDPPRLSVRDVSMAEGNSGLTEVVFNVFFSKPSALPVKVDYETEDDTAVAGEDYVGTSGTLTYSPGETVKTLTVRVNGDTLDETTEAFIVKLTNPTNAVLSAPFHGVGTIRDDDSSCPEPSFGRPNNFAAGPAPWAVVAADFNRDGRLDLAVGNDDSSSVSILLGDGAGGFAAASNFPAVVRPRSLAAGDFNGDGKPDLAATGSPGLGSTAVAVLLGDGAGRFGAPSTFNAGREPAAVAVVDLNGDAKADLAVANSSSFDVSILLGDGAGGFGAATNYTAGGRPVSIAAGDFNSDGRADLVTATQNPDGASIFINKGDGHFKPAVVFPFRAGVMPRSVAVADFNGDRTLDLAVVSRNSIDAFILLGDGAGGFTTGGSFEFYLTPNLVVAGDFNGDSLADLAVSHLDRKFPFSPPHTIVFVRFGNGRGRFSAPSNFGVESSESFGLAAGDFNADGRLDLAVSSVDKGNVSLLLNTCSSIKSAPKVQFSSPSYKVSEQAGEVVIRVMRSGDASAPASVEYATADGTASGRGDYTASLGRLDFAAGETSKTFTVFVADDAHVESLETINLTLGNAEGASIGVPGASIVTVGSDDATGPAANPVDGETFFVRQHYRDFLNRDPDPSGLSFWTGEIAGCGADLRCREVKRVNVSAAFFLSIEFQQTGFLVYRMQAASYGTQPRHLAFLRDTQAVGRGVVVNQDDWQARLEANKRSLGEAWVARAEFRVLYEGKTNAQYVDALIANAGVAFTQSARDALVAGLDGGTETRATVLRKVAEDQAFARKEFGRAFVLMQYFGYLRRDPDAAPDADFTGYEFWLRKLDQFGGNFIQAEMVKAFLDSDEYRKRFGQ